AMPQVRRHPVRHGNTGIVASCLREHGQALAMATLATVGLGVCLVGAIAALDWALLAVMLSLSVVAGFAFYFRSLPLAIALASELNRSPVRLFARRHWRLWP